MEPNEHEEVYNKPWEIWAYEKCRECQHPKFLHLQVLPQVTIATDKSGGTVGACNRILNGGGFCNCREFLPPDNLDYIELLAKRRGLIPDDKDKNG